MIANTQVNKKRRLGKQIRHYPEDRQAQQLFAARYSEAEMQQNLKAVIKRAKRRATRRRAKADRIGNSL